MYTREAFGSDQNFVIEERKKLFDKYLKYEEYLTIDENIRKEKLLEWNKEALKLMAIPEFTFDSIKKMIELKKDKKYVNIKKI